jgi:hypothetical protein
MQASAFDESTTTHQRNTRMQTILILLYFLLVGGGYYWICYNALKNDGWITALLCGAFIPYTIYYGFKRFAQNKIPLMLFLVGITGGIAYLFIASTVPQEINAVIRTLTPYDLIGFAGMTIAALASIWVVFNAFHRDSMMSGLLCSACWPYLLYYGVKNFAANKIPMSILIFGACLLLIGIALGRGM